MTIIKKFRTRIKETVSNWRLVLSFFKKYNDKTVGVLFFTSILSALFGVGLSYMLSYFINSVISQSRRITVTIAVFSVAIIVAYIISLLLGVLRNAVMRQIEMRSSEKIQREAIDFSASDDYLHFISDEQKNKHTYMANVSGNCNRSILNGVVNFVHGVFTVIGSTVVIYSISSWWSIPMTILLMVISLTVENNNSKKRFELFGNTIRDNRMMSYYSGLLTGSSQAYETTLYGLSNHFHTKMKMLNSDIVAHKKKTTSETARNTMLFRIIYSLVYVAFVLLILLNGRIRDVGSIFLVFSLTKSIISCSSNIGHSVSYVYTQSRSINEFNNYLKKRTDNVQVTPQSVPKTVEKGGAEDDAVIRVNHLNFRYYNNEEVLKDISFSIYKNEKIAIVGENGAGKTTLVNVLLGLFNSHGSVSVNGADPYIDMNSRSSQCNIVSVMQNFGRYNGISVQDNIAFGKELPPHVRSSLRDIMDMTDDETDKMLSATLGNEFNGIGVSGGQWQKIALLRGKMEHEIVILDEPTASLDPISEVKVLNDFLMSDERDDDEKTKIIITHRLGCTKYVDRIIVLDHGTVVESGTFDELIARRGKYYEMYMAQAELYRV